MKKKPKGQTDVYLDSGSSYGDIEDRVSFIFLIIPDKDMEIQILPGMQDIMMLMRAMPPDLQEMMEGSTFEDSVRTVGMLALAFQAWDNYERVSRSKP